MVLMADTRISTTDLVVDAVAAAYAAAGGTTVTTDLEAASDTDVPGRAVVAADLGVVECVVGDDDPLSTLGVAVSRMATSGWAVTVLAPSARLGDVHRELRGRPATVQAWWIDADTIQFGRHEVL